MILKTILKQLSLLSRCKLSFPIVSWKISSLPNFAFKSPKRRFNGIEENDRKPVVIPDKKCHLNRHFSPHLVHAHSKQWYYTSDLSDLYMTSLQ